MYFVTLFVLEPNWIPQDIFIYRHHMYRHNTILPDILLLHGIILDCLYFIGLAVTLYKLTSITLGFSYLSTALMFPCTSRHHVWINYLTRWNPIFTSVKLHWSRYLCEGVRLCLALLVTHTVIWIALTSLFLLLDRITSWVLRLFYMSYFM